MQVIIQQKTKIRHLFRFKTNDSILITWCRKQIRNTKSIRFATDSQPDVCEVCRLHFESSHALWKKYNNFPRLKPAWKVAMLLSRAKQNKNIHSKYLLGKRRYFHERCVEQMRNKGGLYEKD